MRYYWDEDILVFECDGPIKGVEFLTKLDEVLSTTKKDNILLLFDSRKEVFNPTLEEQKQISTVLSKLQGKRIKKVSLLSQKSDSEIAELSMIIDRIHGVQTELFTDMAKAKEWLMF